ncbi:glutathione S-transferase-like isoform X2 [Cylas formicarius]|nr:glutathione S-transferase-like isoform X2 [Cylas formicarius]
MAPNYKLIYFDAPGRAETIRYIFAVAGVEYEDYRFPKEKWPELKKEMPFGKVPVLEIDGRQVAQSNAIARYLAKQFGLAGKSDWEALQSDVLVDTLEDLKMSMMGPMREQDPIRKEEQKVKVMKEVVPYYLSKFEKIVSENGGFSVGSELTWSDLAFAVSLDYFEQVYGGDALRPYPALKGLKDKVHALPAIADWIAKRPPAPAKP